MNRRNRRTFAEVVERVKTTVLSPAVTGSFYPNSPEILSTQVQDFIDTAQPRLMSGDLNGLISPHAGVAYSGHVAAHAYKQLAGKSYDTVVLIGLSHGYPVYGSAIYPRGRFRTPLGDIEIDEEIAGEIMQKNRNVANLPEAHACEHSLEVQLPFLQKVLPKIFASSSSFCKTIRAKTSFPRVRRLWRRFGANRCYSSAVQISATTRLITTQ